jgi:hypothetical protein
MEAWGASEPLEWKGEIVRSKQNGMHVISHIVILQLMICMPKCLLLTNSLVCSSCQ